MDHLPQVGERVRIGSLVGTVLRVFPLRRQVEVKLENGVKLSIDALCLQPAPDPVEEPA